ncbi:hypothetical protein Ciccas_009632 [Cichlidogyrus casuarinus]|uniref:RRM domain-containing protein n=1 Tax=Cichlidogyrus casuarinus TaxID=1844966 RepID=A0ABD2PWY2_9PLAT
MSCSNVTNRQDPVSLRSRIFVGNLNTVKMPRTEVEQVFAQYGTMLGVSLHKGYGFVQYSNEYSARAACQGEDNKIYYGMPLDVTIASEPKNRKRGRPHAIGNSPSQLPPSDMQMMTNVGGQFSQMSMPSAHYVPTPYVNPVPVYQTPAAQYMVPVQQTPIYSQHSQSITPQQFGSTVPVSSAAKRTRLEPLNRLKTVTPVTTSDSQVVKRNRRKRKPNTIDDKHKCDVDPKAEDILICGKCRRYFDEVTDLVSHKLAGCKLDVEEGSCKPPGEPESLSCASCSKKFDTSWQLIVHCEDNHEMSIYGKPACSSSEEEYLDSEHGQDNEWTAGLDIKDEPQTNGDAVETAVEKEEEVNKEVDAPPPESADDTVDSSPEKIPEKVEMTLTRKKRAAATKSEVSSPSQAVSEPKKMATDAEFVVTEQDPVTPTMQTRATKRSNQSAAKAARRPKSAPRLSTDQLDSEDQ